MKGQVLVGALLTAGLVSALIAQQGTRNNQGQAGQSGSSANQSDRTAGQSGQSGQTGQQGTDGAQLGQRGNQDDPRSMTPDQRFISSAYKHNLFEIQFARLVSDKAGQGAGADQGGRSGTGAGTRSGTSGSGASGSGALGTGGAGAGSTGGTSGSGAGASGSGSAAGAGSTISGSGNRTGGSSDASGGASTGSTAGQGGASAGASGAAAGHSAGDHAGHAHSGAQGGTDVRQFARMLIEEHTRANEELRRLAQSKNIQVPQQMDEWQQAKLQHLSRLPAEDLARKFVFDQVGLHHVDILEHRYISTNAQDQDVKQLASRMLPDLQKHLQHSVRLAQQFAGGQDPTVSER